MKTHHCETCSLREKAEKSPKSFIGKFWYWHIRFCPGWKSYQKSINTTSKKK